MPWAWTAGGRARRGAGTEADHRPGHADLGGAAVRGGRLHALRAHATRTQTVFGVGDTRADWLIVGEAPGAEEDRQGEPFVGRAGPAVELHAARDRIGPRTRCTSPMS